MTYFFEVRKAKIEDIDQIRNCELKVLGFEYPQNVYQKIINENLSFVISVKNAPEAIIGCILCKFIGNIAEIMDICVLYEYQGMGLGKMLLKNALLTLKSYTVTLRVKYDNLRAINLYKSFGFKFTTIEPDLLNMLYMSN